MTTTPVMVRTSERTMFTKCRQHWFWAYKEQRKPINTFSQPLVFGDMIHRALAAYYIPETKAKRKRGPHPAATFIDIYDAYGRTFHVPQGREEEWADARDLGIEMMENYIERWKVEDRNVLVLYPEMPFQFPIYGDDGKLLCIYVGTADALIRDMNTGHYGLFEHKTAANITTNHLFMDEQANTYWSLVPEWLYEAGVIKDTGQFKFMLYNFMRKKTTDDRPMNAKGQYLNKPTKDAMLAKLAEAGLKPPKSTAAPALWTMLEGIGVPPEQLGSPSKLQPPPLFERLHVRRGVTERQKTLTRIKEQVWEMNEVRQGRMSHYKSPSRECAMCEFKDVCEIDETGGYSVELKRTLTEKWAPYKDHVWSLALA